MLGWNHCNHSFQLNPDFAVEEEPLTLWGKSIGLDHPSALVKLSKSVCAFVQWCWQDGVFLILFFLTWSLNKIALSKLHSINQYSEIINLHYTLWWTWGGRKREMEKWNKPENVREQEAWNCPDRQAGTERTGVLGELHPRCYSAGQRHSVPAHESHCCWLCTASSGGCSNPSLCSELSWLCSS